MRGLVRLRVRGMTVGRHSRDDVRGSGKPCCRAVNAFIRTIESAAATSPSRTTGWSRPWLALSTRASARPVSGPPAACGWSASAWCRSCCCPRWLLRRRPEGPRQAREPIQLHPRVRAASHDVPPVDQQVDDARLLGGQEFLPQASTSGRRFSSRSLRASAACMSNSRQRMPRTSPERAAVSMAKCTALAPMPSTRSSATKNAGDCCQGSAG